MAVQSERKQVSHMKKGIGENSYAKASYIQEQALFLTKSIRHEAIKDLYLKQHPPILCMADLGCSSAADNTLCVVDGLLETVEMARRELAHGALDYVVYLNDLPGNDFNTLFKSLPCFEDNLELKLGDERGNFFLNVIPRSFYKRLFPNNTMHFVHSSSSLHWLTQEPEGIEENHGNIYIAKTSPPTVIKAYYDQFQEDFLKFLQCRSKELVVGGKMVLSLLGRTSSEAYSKECSYLWDLMSAVLYDMVHEGIIMEEELNSFNIPIYYPSPSELEFLVKREGSFVLNQVHVYEVSWNADDYKSNLSRTSNECDVVQCMRSVAEPLLIKQFGETIIDDIYERYQKIVHALPMNENNAFVNVTLLITKV